MLYAHRPWSKDQVQPYAARFNGYWGEKEIAVETKPEDYMISVAVTPWAWVYRTKWGSASRVFAFYNRADAQAYIDRRCNPQAIEAKFYIDSCFCGSKTLGWDYRIVEDVVYHHCNDCNKPLYDIHKDQINQFAIADVDLFDLL